MYYHISTKYDFSIIITIDSTFRASPLVDRENAKVKEHMIKRRVFYSFHYEKDAWRAAQIRNMGVIEGNAPVSDNDWEEVKRGGDRAIQNWIENQLAGRSCTIVLIGEQTAERKWVKYEIQRSWELGKGIFGIYIHNLKDQYGRTSRKGANPFDYVTIYYKYTPIQMSKIIKTYDYPILPPFSGSQDVYNYIKNNLNNWVEEAIKQRESFARLWN